MMRGGPPACWLGGWLVTTRRIKLEPYAMLQDRGLFVTRMGKTLETGNMRRITGQGHWKQEQTI